MKRDFARAFAMLAALSGCTYGPAIPATVGRPVLPPQERIAVGSLYYVQEQPTDDRSKPADLQPLCILNLADYQIQTLPPNRVADINVLRVLEVQGTLSGLRSTFASVGLKGGINRYYELKLTNVSKIGLSRDDAETAFRQLRGGPKCSTWFNSVSSLAIYQVESVYVGDLSFGRKSGTAISASVAAKLAAIEPTIEAELKSQTQSDLSGKGLVFAFVPIRRN